MDANLVMVVVPITRSLWRIDNLIGIEDEDNTAQDTRFANYLRQLFPSDVPTMTVAARALGMNKKKKKKKNERGTTEFSAATKALSMRGRWTKIWTFRF